MVFIAFVDIPTFPRRFSLFITLLRSPCFGTTHGNREDEADDILHGPRYIWSVLLYGVEGWTLKISSDNKLEAFQM